MPGLQTKKINGEEMWKDKKSWWTLRRRESEERKGGEDRWRGEAQKGRRMRLMQSKRKRETEGEGENDMTKDGVRGERERRNQDESSLTWTTYLDLNNRSRSAFEIALAPANTLLRVHARAHRTERSSLHITQMDERDARYDNAVKYTTVLNEVPWPLTRLIRERV